MPKETLLQSLAHVIDTAIGPQQFSLVIWPPDASEKV